MHEASLCTWLFVLLPSVYLMGSGVIFGWKRGLFRMLYLFLYTRVYNAYTHVYSKEFGKRIVYTVYSRILVVYIFPLSTQWQIVYLILYTLVYSIVYLPMYTFRAYIVCTCSHLQESIHSKVYNRVHKSIQHRPRDQRQCVPSVWGIQVGIQKSIHALRVHTSIHTGILSVNQKLDNT